MTEQQYGRPRVGEGETLTALSGAESIGRGPSPRQEAVQEALTSLIQFLLGATIGDDSRAGAVGELASMAMPVGALRSGLKGASRGPIRAYHGSPHDFDTFSMSKIGTGEGAQAYGHGLYFAESPDVARTYQAKVAAMQGRVQKPMIEGRPLNWDDPVETAAFELWRHNGDRRAAADFYERTFKGSDVPSILRSNRPLPSIDAPGRMYEVNINASPDDFLDWDAPLSQQSQQVMDRVKRAGYWPDEKSPEYVYGADVARHSDPAWNEDRAIMLHHAGIPGIKYLDEGSRGAGKGTRNYVVFDDKLIEILRKYGILGALSSGALGDYLMRSQPQQVQQ